MTRGRLLHRAAKLIERLRAGGLPGLGLVDLTEAEVSRALRQRHLVVLEHDPVPVPLLVVLQGGGTGGEVHLGDGYAPVQRVLLLLRALARHDPHGRSDQDAADIVALAGVFPHAGRVLGEPWQVKRVRLLRARPEVWTGRSLPDLLGLVDDLAPAIDPPEPPRDRRRTAGAAASAYAVGREQRARGEHAKALVAFARAEFFAGQIGAWDLSARAILAAGIAQKARGNYAAARSTFARCRRVARRHKVREVAGMAAHELFSLAVELGYGDRARALARRALADYSPGSEGVARLAYDYADLLITEGSHAEALPVVLEAARQFGGRPEEVTMWGSVARAAGGAGDPSTYAAAALRAQNCARQSATGENVGRGLLDCARGALLLRQWPVALNYAHRALAVAAERMEALVRLEAAAVLDAAAAQRDEPPPRSEKRRPAPLTRQLVRALRRAHVSAAGTAAASDLPTPAG